MSVFEGNMMGGSDRQHCWYIDSMNSVFTFLCAVFTRFDFLDLWSSHNCVRKIGSEWWLFVSHVFRLFLYKTQTNSYYQFFAV